jgi:peptidoglycan/LPS O-acetylase OafA/YrhL
MLSGEKAAAAVEDLVPGLERGTVYFVALDGLRFLMALLVVLFHYEMLVVPEASADQRKFMGFDAAVDFFFILSGFVICHANERRSWDLRSYMDYLRRRLARIYPLHAATLLTLIGMTTLASFIGVTLNNPERFAISEIPSQIFLVHAWGVSDRLTFNDVSWSISAEFFLYLIFPAVLIGVRQVGVGKASAGLATIILMLAWLTGGAMEPHWMRRTYEFGILRAFPSFVLGVILWHVWAARRLTISSWRWPIVLSLLALALMLFDAPRELTLCVFGWIVVLTATVEAQRPVSGKWNLWIRRLGDVSFGLYMIHSLVGLMLFKALVPKIELLNEMRIIAAIVAFMLSLALAAASYRYLEAPARRWITAHKFGWAPLQVRSGKRGVEAFRTFGSAT